jgi:hypothetical protein
MIYELLELSRRETLFLLSTESHGTMISRIILVGDERISFTEVRLPACGVDNDVLRNIENDQGPFGPKLLGGT